MIRDEHMATAAHPGAKARATNLQTRTQTHFFTADPQEVIETDREESGFRLELFVPDIVLHKVDSVCADHWNIDDWKAVKAQKPMLLFVNSPFLLFSSRGKFSLL